ncbi:phage minor head protein [Candidatus Nitronereus thalassa]|uniref:Phage minor head protein n=1 Tax=Candidatus Nitronereus thalassa TaxID=3020898 RepID=A0ABU3K3A0_9BACT|nr:phage minor head protein [Candidatus Nitronereus thalassa]MDT7040865.1 phage minor head protein [Candidatus Nitronereus thalassa]
MSEREDVRIFQEQIRQQRKQVVEDGQLRVRRLLQRTHREIIGTLAVTDWQKAFLPRMQLAIEDALARIEGQVSSDLTELQQANWLLGDTMTTGTVQAMRIGVALPDLPTSLLQALQQRAGETVKGLLRIGKVKIDRAVTGALLGGQTREEAIKAIGQALEFSERGVKPQGIFPSVDRRARFIFQHEAGQAFSTAQALRRDAVVSYAPDLQKVWVHDGHPLVPRGDHVAMHGTRIKNDEAFVNPFTGHALRFPRDGQAPIEETANCTCDVMLYRPAYGDVESFIGLPTGTPIEEAA